MNQIYSFINGILFEEENYEDENINENPTFDICLFSNYNNNDAFVFLATIFVYFKLFIISFYESFLAYISILSNYFFKLQNILLLTLFLFSFVVTFQDNSNITTDLIISAYFPNRNITRITQDMLLQKKIKNEKIFQFSNDNNIININITNYYNLEQNNSNIKKIIGNFICDIMEEKNCNYTKYNINDNYTIDYEEKIIVKNDDDNKSKNNSFDNFQKDGLFLYFISIKSLLITTSCFICLYFIIKKTMNSKRRSSLLLNFLSLFFLYNLATNLYVNKYYLASNFIFILLMYTNKNLIDSVFLKLKFKRKDFEIFTSNLMALNSKQFFLKLLILSNATVLSSILSILYFKSWLNYILSYLCLLSLISFLGNCLEEISPLYLKPIKNIIIFFVGTTNLILSKLILKSILFNKKIYENYNCFINNNNDKIYCKKDINNINVYSYDSLYLINDLFSLYCLGYINGFLEYQLHDFFSGNKNYIYKCICNFIFIFVILIGYFGIYIQEFICLFISLYLAKITMNNFSKLFHFKICRILNFLFILKYLLFIQRMIKIRDNYLINIILSITHLNEVIILFSIKFIFLLSFIYYIINTIFVFYVVNNNKINQEIKDQNQFYYNNSKIFNFIYTIIEMILQYLIICVIIIIYNYYENKFIFKVLYIIVFIIFHSLKISIAYEINENKDKTNIINYNIFVFILIIISLRLIKLSSFQISLIYLLNHLNLVLIINYCILNDKNKNNNFFKIIIILLLALGYYDLNSSIFIIDAIALVISPIIKNLKNYNNQEINSKEDKIKIENLKAYNRLTFLFTLSIIIFSLVQIGNANNCDILAKYYKDIIDNIKNLMKAKNDRKNFDKNVEIEFLIISKFLN